MQRHLNSFDTSLAVDSFIVPIIFGPADDVMLPQSSLTFPAGSTTGQSVCINISIVNDVLVEDEEEEFILGFISDTALYKTLTILDDDSKLAKLYWLIYNDGVQG